MKEYSISTDSKAYLGSVFEKYCESSGSVRNGSFGIGLDIVAKSIPISLSGSHSSNEEAVRNFCKNYSSSTFSSMTSTDYKEKIVKRAYDSFDQCIGLANTGVIVRHAVRSLETIDFYVAPGFSRPVEINGISTSENIECIGQKTESDKIKLSIFDMSTKIVLKDDRTFNMVCKRKGQLNKDNVKIFEEGTITLLTNIIPNGNYGVFVPKDSLLPENKASEIEENLRKVLAENISLKKNLDSEIKSREIADAKLGKWLLNIYSEAHRVGMPKHQGANGWWQKSLVDSYGSVSKQLPN